ncbi:MAG TPA: heterodisulfide reductase-related iron-sulfur binding cluster, partial [Nitrososphaerales archaeon]|nr:heterodisulfide reductase-related iron-sulfur binding cluster [Nitrososphaerales archaeon]
PPLSEPARQSYLFLPSYAPALVYIAFFVAGLIMLFGLYRHLRSYGMGIGEFLSLSTKDLGTKARRFAKFDLGQEKVLAGGSGGVMHGAIFYGFLMLFIYTSLVFIQSDILPVLGGGTFLKGDFYLTLEFLGDTFGIFFIVGLVIAVYRRYVQRLPKLKTAWDDRVVLGMLIWIGVSGFIVESLRFVAIPSQWAFFSPVGDVLSQIIGRTFTLSVPQAQVVYQSFRWAHMFSVMALIAATPYTKLIHVFTSASNVVLAPEKPRGRLSTPFSLAAMLETGNVEIPPNVRTAGGFSPLRLLALDACTNCGRCVEVCPANAAGRDLSPRDVVRDLGREARAAPTEDVFSTGVIRESELWACTTCNACVEACPVFINQVDYIVDFRRTLVAENRLDPMKRTFLENVGRANNPFGLPQQDRQSWLVESGVPTLKTNPAPEYIYWVGCQGSYDPRGRRLTRAVVRILDAAKVNYAVLGNEEVCTGEPVRRMGEEARFQELALKNIESIVRSGATKVVVHCPHCFNTFLNEYPEFGAKFQVIHHSQLIMELVGGGKLELEKREGAVTFHDPCNLGRVNGVYEAPRDVIKASEGFELVEMPRSREKSFCCGGGGANVWYQVPEKTKISVLRMEEAVKTGAKTLAVACPFCITLLEDAAKGPAGGLEVRDVAEIIAERLPLKGS